MLTKWSHGQPFQLWRYTENGYAKNQLQKDIQSAKNIEEAVRIIQIKVPNPTNEIIILYKTEEGINAVKIANGKVVRDDRISFVTKGSAPTEISSIYELKHFVFFDTLVILDTCRIDVTLLNKEEDMDEDGYYFQFNCTGAGEKKNAALPSNDDNQLLIVESAFEKCRDGYYQVSLFNDAFPGKALASSGIFFLDSSIKKILLEDAIALSNSQIGLEQKELAMLLTWSLRKYGHVNYRDMVAWLDRNYYSKTKRDGN